MPKSRPKLRVQHMVAGHTVRQYGSNPTSDLLGVAYSILYPLDTEFPVSVPQIDLFTRFFVHRPGEEEFFVRVWTVADGRLDSCIKTVGPFVQRFDEAHPILDRHFRVKYLSVPRPGRLALRLSRNRSEGWRGEGWSVLATEFITVQRG